jgi:membrane fusion protein (multidrug efflux system)
MVRVEIDAFPGETFAGEVSAINPNVNPTTRTIEIQAAFSNLNGKLLPGMFGRVHLDLGADTNVLAIPASSVVYAPYGNFVFVVQRKSASEGDKKPEEGAITARQQLVTLGDRRGDLVSILTGLSAGDEIVSTGGFKLIPGDAIVVQNQNPPSDAEKPSLQDS